MANLNLRDSKGAIKKRLETYISKKLEEDANSYELLAKNIIRDELEKKYKENVKASYSPRSARGQRIKKVNLESAKYRQKTGKGYHSEKVTYRHTGIFLNSIYAKIKDHTVKIMIRNEKYPDGTSTLKVYRWLTQGTKGGEENGKPYPYTKKQGDNYNTGWSRNFATPAHLFEEHTKLQMRGFLEELANDIENGNAQQKYAKYLRKTQYKE